jgi:hypothetical protein
MSIFFLVGICCILYLLSHLNLLLSILSLSNHGKLCILFHKVVFCLVKFTEENSLDLYKDSVFCTIVVLEILKKSLLSFLISS